MRSSIRGDMPLGQKVNSQSPPSVSPEEPVGGERVQIEPIDLYWEPVSYLDGDTALPSQLHAKVIINGCPMHLEAYLVGDDGEVCDRKQKSAIDCMKVALRDDQAWQAIDYEGYPYVVMAIPYGKTI